MLFRTQADLMLVAKGRRKKYGHVFQRMKRRVSLIERAKERRINDCLD